MTDATERLTAPAASTPNLSPRSTGGNTTTRPATIRATRWPRLVAALLATLYLVGVAGGWASNAADAYYGIARIDAPPGEPNLLVLVEVVAGSPADRAGLLPNDVILAIDEGRLGENLIAGSRRRYVPAGAAPSFRTRPLAVPSGDAPAFRRTTGERGPGNRTTIQVRRQTTAADGSTATIVHDVTLVLGSRLTAAGTVVALLTWHVVALLTLATGLFVTLHRPSDLASRLLLVTTSCFAMALVLLSWNNRPLQELAALALTEATVLLLVLGSASLLHLCLIFPAPNPLFSRLDSPKSATLRLVPMATLSLYILPLVLSLGLFLGPAVVWPWSYLVVISLIGAALLALAGNILHPPSPVARAQLKWIAGPLIVGLVALALGPGMVALSGARIELLPATATVAAWVLFPLGLGIAIVRYRLFDVDVVLRAAMFYPLVAALLGAGYLASALVLGRVVAVLFGPGTTEDMAVSLLAALVVAASAQPLYQRLQTGLDRLLYRERLARRLLLEEASRLPGQARPEDVANFLTTHVADRLDLAGAWLVLPNWVTASHGQPPSALLRSTDDLFVRMEATAEPVLLLRKDEFIEGGPGYVDASDPAFAPWHAAGARLLLPLRSAVCRENSSVHGLLGVWLVGRRRSGSFPDSEDLKALAQVARQAELLLDRDRLQRVEAAESRRVERFRRYFSPQVATLIAEEGELATHRRELTVLVAELHGIGGAGAVLEPEELVHRLNSCLASVTDAVFEYGGTLDRYSANGVMAFFGDPLPQADHAARAMQAALAIRRRLGKDEQPSSLRASQFSAGIGLATGWLTVGTIGSRARQEYTVVGDAVTVAARLAGMASPDEVLLAEKTRELLAGNMAAVPRGELRLDGWRQGIRFFGASPGLVKGLDAPTAVPNGSQPRDQAESTEPLRDASARAQLLARTALFASVPTEELMGLASRLHLQRFAKGAAILRAHEPCSSFFLISSGTVKVTRALVTGDDAVMSILGRGEFFGELALLEGQSGDYTVVALQPTEVLVLSRDVFLDCLKAYPSAVSAAIALLSRRIRLLTDRLEEAYSLELPQRLARRLVELGEMHGTKTPEGTVIDLPLTQSDLAAMVGASRQRVNRLLAKWQDRRLLRLGSFGKMTLLHPGAFADLSPERLDD